MVSKELCEKVLSDPRPIHALCAAYGLTERTINRIKNGWRPWRGASAVALAQSEWNPKDVVIYRIAPRNVFNDDNGTFQVAIPMPRVHWLDKADETIKRIDERLKQRKQELLNAAP